MTTQNENFQILNTSGYILPLENGCFVNQDINSIKRISDDIIFSIGDYVANFGLIKGFRLIGFDLFALCEIPDVEINKVYAHYSILNHISKNIINKEKDIPKDKPDWEILSFKIFGDIWTLGNKGFYWHTYGSCSLDFLLSIMPTQDAQIHSVKRLFDGEIIELGKTKVKDPNTNHEWIVSEISYNSSHDKIYLSGVWLNHVEIVKPPLLTTEDGVTVCNPSTLIYCCSKNPTNSDSGWATNAASVSLNPDVKYFHHKVNRDQYYAQHMPKQSPLFTTEDGVEIFEGDKYWYVPITSINYTQWGCFQCTSASTGLSLEKYKSFSTEEKAKEYIILNKPIEVSFKQLSEYLKTVFKAKYTESKIIKEFFKSKINL